MINLQELDRNKRKKVDFINRENYSIHLLYISFRSRRKNLLPHLLLASFPAFFQFKGMSLTGGATAISLDLDSTTKRTSSSMALSFYLPILSFSK